ncbi:hypothetical protein GTY78_08080 [Streptomyces sp. SID4934]|uniref:hypothetical protein n=1 Tax=unclassified Streptomyces TaxID=2593676 RepID=UPI00114D1024|nr:hypothetical protein [Streptomyces sp. ScaeMP-6W]MYQ71005.1 hypothetical protein [Streptomyces sp. SID4934]
MKIGITGLRTREDRVARFRGHGWVPFTQIDFATGADAYRVEQSVIRQLRIEGHGGFLGDVQMPIGGYKETFDATSVSAERLLALAEAER